MPTWGQILSEINTEIQQGNQRAFDTVRQKYIQQLAAYTGRNVIVYASRWTSNEQKKFLLPPSILSIH